MINRRYSNPAPSRSPSGNLPFNTIRVRGGMGLAS